MVVWRFKLRAGTGLQHIDVPAGAKLLDIQAQDDGIALWALCTQTERLVERRVEAVGTGDSVEGDGYIATVQYLGGVLHYFDRGELPRATVDAGKDANRH